MAREEDPQGGIETWGKKGAEALPLQSVLVDLSLQERVVDKDH